MTGKNRNKETVPAEYERNPSLFLFDHTLFCIYIEKCLFIQLLANFHIKTDCETGIYSILYGFIILYMHIASHKWAMAERSL